MRRTLQVKLISDRALTLRRLASNKYASGNEEADTYANASRHARRLGYTTTERLYNADRAACKQIAANFRRSPRTHWWRKTGAMPICEPQQLKQVLEDSLASKNPISPHHIAAMLGYSNDGYIHRKFPHLCRAIGAKIAKAKKRRLAQIPVVLQSALREELPPTLSALGKRLEYSTSQVLRVHAPKLCDRLVKRREVWQRNHKKKLRKKLSAVLVETPPPPFVVVCNRMALTRSFIEEHFPDLQQAITRRYRYRNSAPKLNA
jgi:hypothetical protein